MIVLILVIVIFLVLFDSAAVFKYVDTLLNLPVILSKPQESPSESGKRVSTD